MAFVVRTARNVSILTAVAGLCVTANSLARPVYPDRPVHVVVPFAAGGANGLVARALANALSKTMKQTFIVDNKPGAGGKIGTELVARARPDGYTLLSGGMGSLVVSPAIGPVPYNTLRDFSPITLIAKAPNVLVVHPSLPVRNVKQLIALAKARPNQLDYGSGGIGSTPHLSGALFSIMTGVKMVDVPYKGAARAVVGLLEGDVQLAFVGIPVVLGDIQQGKLRAIAVTSLKRAPQLPNVPTVAQSGVKGYDVEPWYGLLAPTGTPRDVVRTLQAKCQTIIHSPDLQTLLLRLGAIPVGSTPGEFEAVIQADLKKWSGVARAAGIRVSY